MSAGSRIVLVLGCVVVFSVAVGVRLTACDESYWIDELHTAWVIDDGLGHVAQRAAIGNQTPYYFFLLWCWHQFAGDAEFWMRLSSVLVSSFASVICTVGVARTVGHVAPGILAGAMLALDPNAVFFGSELRTYASVILCSTLACWMAAITLADDSTPRSRSLGRLALTVAVCVSALLHPTSLGVLAYLMLLTFGGLLFQRRFRWAKSDWCVLAVIVAVAGLLFISSLPESWNRRQQWRVFALATSPWQLWYAWSWPPLVIVPSVIGFVAGLAAMVRTLSKSDSGSEGRLGGSWLSAWVPMLGGILGTATFFVLAYFDWVPLWHRRYYLAALPLLAWSAGAVVRFHWQRESKLAWFLGTVQWLVVLTVFGTMLVHQGTIKKWSEGQSLAESRSEPWREAIESVQSGREEHDAVWLDTGLIEASFLSRPMSEATELSPADKQYLKFPVAGPYRMPDAKLISLVAHASWRREWIKELAPETRSIWVVTRRPRGTAQRFLVSWGSGWEKHSVVFARGRMTVLHVRIGSRGTESDR